MGGWGKFTPKSRTYVIGDTVMKRSKWKQRGNEYARKWAMNYKERRRLADVLELQLAESNKEKRITTKTVTHN